MSPKNLRRSLWFLFMVASIIITNCGWPYGVEKHSLRKATTLIFNYPKDGKFTSKNFFDFPYPHAFRLDADGTPALKNFPNPPRETACDIPPSNNKMITAFIKGIDPDKYIQDLIDYTDQQSKGFGLNSNIYFRFSRPLSSKGLPPLAATLTKESPFFIMDVDEHSSHRGERLPLIYSVNVDSRFLPSNVLIIRPAPGFSLREGTKYAVVVKRSVRDRDGWPLGTPPALRQLASSKKLSDPTQEKMRQLYFPVFEYLRKKHSLSIDDIAAATVFTTGKHTEELQKLYDFIQQKMEKPKPATSIKCEETNEGTPYIICTGHFDSPAFQKGKAPFLSPGTGVFQYDKSGRPIYKMESLRFALTLPKRYFASGALERPLPLVMYAHGTGGNYMTFMRNGVAWALARRGIATFGIDQAVNGERTSKIGSTRLDILFFNALNLPAARDNVRQSALDYFWQVNFLRRWNFSYAGKTIRFDPHRLWYMGHSQGGLIGVLFLAFEEKVRAAFLSAPGAFLIHTLLYKLRPKEPIQISAVGKYLLCDKKGTFNVFHPILSVAQNLYDAGDPINYTPYLLARKHAPLNLLITGGLTDGYVPPQVFDPVVVSMGLPQLGHVFKPIQGLAIKGIPILPLPVRGNYRHASGELLTVGFSQHAICRYKSGRECDGHFVAFHNENAIRNWETFFQSLLYDDIPHIH